MNRWIVLGAAVFAAGCASPSCQAQDDMLQRMMKQPKYLPYQSNDFFPDNRAMRHPPANTVAREHFSANRSLASGLTAGDNPTYVQELPVQVDMALLERGGNRYEIVCATCHGVLGDGQSMVARNMALAKPPSFHSDKLVRAPDGYYFRVITEGYGLMPHYANHLEVGDRWAVVAYIRALQYSQRLQFSQAPAAARQQLLQKETP